MQLSKKRYARKESIQWQLFDASGGSEVQTENSGTWDNCLASLGMPHDQIHTVISWRNLQSTPHNH